MADTNQDLQDLITALATGLADLTTLVHDYIAAVPDPSVAGTIAGSTVVTTATFSTSPGTTNVDSLLDYSTKYGLALYEQATKSLYESEEDKFNLDNARVMEFTTAVSKRAKSMGWNSQNQGIITYVVNGSYIDIIDDYGRIDMADIHTQSQPFYLSTGAKHDMRAAQNNAMMVEMLQNSLTTSARNQVALYKDEYELDDGSGTNTKVVLAPAYYKIIMRLTTLDTKITNEALRAVIKSLPEYAATVNGDITLIHQRFNDHYGMLTARGEDIQDKEDILFDTYANVPDPEFRKYMKQKQSAYEENINEMAGTNWLDIMKKATARYTLMKADRHHTWGLPFQEDDQIIALKAEITNLKKELELKQQLLQATEADSSEFEDVSSEDSEGDDFDNESESIDDASEDAPHAANDSWRTIPFKDGEKTQVRYGKVWNWCTHHDKWCIHKEEDCRLNSVQQTTFNNASREPSSNSTYAALLAHIALLQHANE